MATKDLLEKKYFNNNFRFSNIFNYYLFNGEDVIKEDSLTELDTNLVITDPSPLNRVRDIYKRAVIKTDGKNTFLLLGIENQTKEDQYMVVRNLLYDSIGYHNQIKHIEKNKEFDKIKVNMLDPIFTIVIFYSPKPWKRNKNLRSMIDVGEFKSLRRYLPNYTLNIIEPYKLKSKDFLKFKKELALLFEAIKSSGKKNKFIKLMRNEKFSNVEYETAELINEVTGLNLNIEKKEEVDMCKAMDDLLKDSREEGRAEGIKEGKAQGKAEGREEGKKEALKEYIKIMYSNGYDDKSIAKALSLDLVFVKKILAI